ncbi:DUF305 domain-containing protein [Siccirubricoccus sp. KC 17139]|uniref:DUF305 domain-containing protein n=1 Tax=Siccirubricoccus soli TaxID=2899147 RepID=A0ABT1D1M5_9PROT|nr:DUF305 domain-containing protein [Siccirubricoccus soli]MCO6415821.1 DUF305 domain-containing protein [Siccirubricoccus soli]MCP2681953.1 DUF305 domain-containing protein [Siccirubricoccus soli]
MSSTNQNRAAKRLPLRLTLAAAVAATALATAGSPARAMVGEQYEPGGSPVATTSYSVMSPEALAAAVKADRDYVTGMRAHHAGALSMSEEYLADPNASSPALRELAQAIVHNQKFEIRLLDEVARNLDRPARVVNLGFARLAFQSGATEGLGQRDRFMKYPIPGPLAAVFSEDAPVTERDVQFAKAMTIHHRGALDMARAYQADRNGRNTFLGLLNIDIVTDQTQEIALMRRVITAYAGDAEAVLVPASMVHGMEGMAHGGHGGHAIQASATDPHAGHGVPAAPAPAQRPGASAGHCAAPAPQAARN